LPGQLCLASHGDIVSAGNPSWSGGATGVKVLPSDPESQSFELVEQQESGSSCIFAGGGVLSDNRVQHFVLEVS